MNILIADNIRSVFNVASMYRTSDCLGVSEAWLCGITPGPMDRFNRPRKDFAKASLGAENTVLTRRFANTTEAIKYAKQNSYFVVAIEQAKDSIDYRKIQSHKSINNNTNFAFVLGNEVEGISPEILKLCNVVAEIPLVGNKESLNVTIAYAIVASRILQV